MVSTLLSLQSTAKQTRRSGGKIEELCRKGAILVEFDLWASTSDEIP